MKKDVLFRGCTRPPMILGVPYIPFLVGGGVPLMMSMYFSIYIIACIPPILFVMRMMAKRDEMIFRLVGLNLVFRFLPRNISTYGGSWVFSPNRRWLKGRTMSGYEK